METVTGQDQWYNSWLTNKYELFASLIKLRLPKSPKVMLQTVHGDNKEQSASSITPKSQQAGGDTSENTGAVSPMPCDNDYSLYASFFEQFADQFSDEEILEKSAEILSFLNQELKECTNLLFMSEGYLCPTIVVDSTAAAAAGKTNNGKTDDVVNIAAAETGTEQAADQKENDDGGNSSSPEKPKTVPVPVPPEKLKFKYDVFTFSDDNYYSNLQCRFKFALEGMQIYSYFDVVRPKCREVWLDSLKLAKKWIAIRQEKERVNVPVEEDKNEQQHLLDDSDSSEKLPKNLEQFAKLEKNDEKFAPETVEEYEKLLREICKLLNVSEDSLLTSESGVSCVGLEKFRANDDLYILQNGLPGYPDALNRILDKIGGHEWDMQILEVLEQKAIMIESFEQMRHLVDVLSEASNMIDMRVQKSFNRIFKLAYSHSIFSLKKQVMNYYYQKYQLRDLSSLDSDYGTELNLILNNLAEGMSKGKTRQMAVRLSWHFMLSAKQCWWRLLNAVIMMPRLMPAVVEVLGFLPAVANLRLPEANNERLILAGLSRMLERNMLINEEQETAWVDFVVQLCGGIKKAILDPVQLVDGYLLPLLPKYPWLLLSALMKIFEKEPIKLVWADCEQQQLQQEEVSSKDADESASVVIHKIDEPAIDPARLFTDIFTIYVRATRSGHVENMINLEIQHSCPRVLKALTDRWRRQNVLLNGASLDKIRSTFDALPWTQRFFIDYHLRDFHPSSIESTGVANPVSAETDGNSDITSETVPSSNPASNFVSSVPACLFEFVRLPAEKYSPVDCCHDDPDTEIWADRPARSLGCAGGPPPKAVCALFSLMEAAVQLPELSTLLLNDGDMTSFIGLKPLTLRNHLLYSARNSLEKKNLDEFKNVVKFLHEFYDRFEEKVKHLTATTTNFPPSNSNSTVNAVITTTNTDRKMSDKNRAMRVILQAHAHKEHLIEDSYRKGLKYVAPVILLNDVAFLLIKPETASSTVLGDKDQKQQLDDVKIFLNNLYAVVCESYTRCCETFKTDHLALMTSLRHVWTSCCMLLDRFDKTNCPRPLEYLLMGLLESFRRYHVSFEREWIERISSKLSPDIYDSFCRKLEFLSFS